MLLWMENWREIILSRFTEPAALYQVLTHLLIRLFQRKNISTYTCVHTHTLAISGEQIIELHRHWVFYCETILNSQIILANLWNACVYSNVQCVFWSWSKYTYSNIRKISIIFSLNVVAHYIPISQDTSSYLKNSTYITIQMKVLLWNRPRISFWVSRENWRCNFLTTNHQYRLFHKLYYFFFTNLYQLKTLP